MNRMVLVVDDLKVNRSILTKILMKDGFKTLEAENGREALDIILREGLNISLVLLDLSMPVMNGYELLDELNSRELLSSIPVIVTTSNDQDNAEVISLAHGATDFITKPYNPDVVCHRVSSILRLFENAAMLNRMEKDRLTGTYSREFFYKHARTILDNHPDDEYEILCSDIENFKLINAKYGTEQADELLKYIAKHDMECVGSDGICGRLGADSFVALRKRRIQHTQEQVKENLDKIFENAPIRNFVVQYGLYRIKDRDKTISDMCDNAQLALATIKHKYGMYYSVYDDSMREKMLRKHQLSDVVEEALCSEQFFVYLQPKHDIETGAVAGAEALIRWIHPELGFVSPEEFIPLFEQNGFITKLDYYVWESVCALLRSWIDEGREIFPISVNASRADFDNDNLPEEINDLLEKYEIPTEYFHLEVTESAYTDNPKQIISAVSTLRDMGFLIEMDDFGSGYSSLNMLSELPICFLKLDMRFLQGDDAVLSTNKRRILSFVISLSKWLQLPTIAEGVETKEDVELLKSMGCNYIQGYYYARPMPVKDFEEYIGKPKHASNNEKNTSSCNQESIQTAESPENRYNVLVVEDIEGNRELIKSILEPKYKVIEAVNGEVAYEYIKFHHDELSCILLDLLMPVMDGFRLLNLMKGDGYLDEIPVIITSEAGIDSELRALHLGANDFVSKPYNREILIHHVKKSINEREYRKLCT